MTTLYIVRGVAGSGKTTRAMAIQDDPKWEYPPFHFEADQYFTEPDGHYRFDPEYLGDAHQWCYLNAKRHMLFGDPVVVSNTFTVMREVRPYLDLARRFGYDVVVETAMGDYQSVHDVPDTVLERQRARLVPHFQFLRDVREYMSRADDSDTE